MKGRIQKPFVLGWAKCIRISFSLTGVLDLRKACKQNGEKNWFNSIHSLLIQILEISSFHKVYPLSRLHITNTEIRFRFYLPVSQFIQLADPTI